MSPKKQTDPTYRSTRGNMDDSRQNFKSFDDLLLDNAWIGRWDDDWSSSDDSPSAKRFYHGDERNVSWVSLKNRPEQVKTFETQGGQVPLEKKAFWKRLFKETPRSLRDNQLILVAIPFPTDLWCWAYRFQVTTDGRIEDVFTVLHKENNRSSLKGQYHEKYSYLLRDEVMGQRSYSRNNFLYVATGVNVPKKDKLPSRTSNVNAQKLQGQHFSTMATSTAGEGSNAGETAHDPGLEGMADDLGSVPVPVPENDYPTDAGATSASHAYIIPHDVGTLRGRSETLRTEVPQPASFPNDQSPTDHTVPSIESSETTQKEEYTSEAEALFKQFGLHTGSARPTNAAHGEHAREPRPRSDQLEQTRDAPTQKQKRMRDQDDDCVEIPKEMLPPQRPKMPRTTGPTGRGVDGSPSQGLQSCPLYASRSSASNPISRFTISSSSNSKLEQAPQRLGHAEEVSSVDSSFQRRDSPMQVSPSDATVSHQSEEQLQREARVSTSGAEPARRTPQTPALPIRTSPAVAHSMSPPRGIVFDVDRALLKLIVVGGNNRVYGMGLHGCNTVQDLFKNATRRVAAELGPGDVLHKIVFYFGIVVPQNDGAEVDVPFDHDISFRLLLSSVEKVLQVLNGDVEIKGEVSVTRGR